VTLYRHLGCATYHVDTAPAHDVVPDCLLCLVGTGTMQDRERRATEYIFHTCRQQFRTRGVVLGVLVDEIRGRRGATALVNVQLEGIRIGLDQRLHTTRHFVGIFRQVLGVDGEDHLVRGERVRVMLT